MKAHALTYERQVDSRGGAYSGRILPVCRCGWYGGWTFSTKTARAEWSAHRNHAARDEVTS